MVDKAIIVIAIIHAVVDFGGIFERRKWIFISELIRLATIPVLIYYYLANYQYFNILLTGTIIFCLFSVFYILKNRSSLIRMIAYGK